MELITKNTQPREQFQHILQTELGQLLKHLGEGRVDGVAYDTAWVARLVDRYDQPDFAAALKWLRQNQHDDGTWGAPIEHFHDRYISTLAAIVTLSALSPANQHPRDKRRIARGEQALWRLVGKLGRDDQDTIGFPLLSAALTEEATQLGLEVPQPPVRYGAAYQHKVKKLLAETHRNWRENTLSFSLEALRHAVSETDDVLDDNNSVGVSPAATAGYLLKFEHPTTIQYLLDAMLAEMSRIAPALAPIDTFEIAWSLNHLRCADLITPQHPDVERCLNLLWNSWSQNVGIGYSSHSRLTDLDCTSASFPALKWGGFAVDTDSFSFFETEDHFKCFRNETDPSSSIHVRLLAAVRTLDDSEPFKALWIEKILYALSNFDENGSFWTDKWHISPYYVNALAVRVLFGLDNEMVRSRLKWILRTQNDDGGWGFYDQSTPEETAYCLETLLWWDKHVERLDDAMLLEAADYLHPHLYDSTYVPLWIGKSLYSPYYPIKAVIIGALHSYMNRDKSWQPLIQPQLRIR